MLKPPVITFRLKFSLWELHRDLQYIQKSTSRVLQYTCLHFTHSTPLQNPATQLQSLKQLWFWVPRRTITPIHPPRLVVKVSSSLLVAPVVPFSFTAPKSPREASTLPSISLLTAIRLSLITKKFGSSYPPHAGTHGLEFEKSVTVYKVLI